MFPRTERTAVPDMSGISQPYQTTQSQCFNRSSPARHLSGPLSVARLFHHPRHHSSLAADVSCRLGVTGGRWRIERCDGQGQRTLDRLPGSRHLPRNALGRWTVHSNDVECLPGATAGRPRAARAQRSTLLPQIGRADRSHAAQECPLPGSTGLITGRTSRRPRAGWLR